MEKKELLGFTFVNEAKNTRDGFCHISHLFNEYGREIATGRVNYLNRTWERYEFQTSMKKAVSKALDETIDYLRDVYKIDCQIKRMTKKHQEEFERLLAGRDDIKALNEVLNAL